MLLAALAVASTAAAEPNEIVVVAERLQRVTVSVTQDREGRWYCSMDASSGVPSLDANLCKAVTKCVRNGAATEAATRACVSDSKSFLLAQYRREWARRH